MKELFWIIVGMIIMAILFNFEDIKRTFKNYILMKKYVKLASGIPSRVVGLDTFDDVWWKRKLPLYIEGNIYTIKFRWFHCNDETVVVENKIGEQFRLESKIVSSVFISKNRWDHKRAIYMKPNFSNQTNFVSRFVKPDAILEVY